jgi:hypothetical protein
MMHDFHRITPALIRQAGQNLNDVVWCALAHINVRNMAHWLSSNAWVSLGCQSAYSPCVRGGSARSWRGLHPKKVGLGSPVVQRSAHDIVVC